MILSMEGQALLFLSMVLVGAAIGLLYDAFRIFRKTARHNGLAVQLEDLLFWLTATGLTFYFILHRNYGEIRPFLLLGIVIGVVLYFATVSRWVVAVMVAVVNYIKKVVKVAVRIILLPINLAIAWLSPPAKKIYVSMKKQARKVKRHGKNKLKKTARDWRVFRKKV